MGVEKYTTPGGKIAWMVDLTAKLPNGREVRFRKRKIPTREQAKALESKTLGEIFDSIYFESRRTIALTIRQLWEQYKPITLRDNRSHQSDQGRAEHVLRHLGDHRAMTLTRADVEEYRKKRLGEKTRRGKPPKSSTLNREVALLKRLFSYAVECERLPHSPIAHVPMLEEKNVRQRTVSEAEIAQVVAAAGPYLGPLFLAYYDTGMRKTELRLLRRACLDLTRKAIRLRPEDTKTGKGRVVPLTDRVVAAIRSLPTPLGSEYVFVNPETSGPWNDPYRLFRKVCQGLGIEGVWLHDTRRSFSTNARRRGSSESEVMKVTGHTTRSTFDRYNIVDEEDAREVIRRLEAGTASELARTEQKSRQDSVKMDSGCGRKDEGPTSQALVRPPVSGAP
jgi:integrase